MIRHIVMWRVRGVDAVERRINALTVRAAFEARRGKIPGMRHLEIGLDICQLDYACDVALLTDFDDERSLAAYAMHPAHLRAKELAGDLRIERHQVNYEFDPASPALATSRAPV
jgi:hypothetical protein